MSQNVRIAYNFLFYFNLEETVLRRHSIHFKRESKKFPTELSKGRLLQIQTARYIFSNFVERMNNNRSFSIQ